MENLPTMCGRCFDFVEYEDLHDAPCFEKPELLKGTTQGMYHCPDCGQMIMAGMKHPKVCKTCFNEMKGGK